jgi:hypothetical protein
MNDRLFEKKNPTAFPAVGFVVVGLVGKAFYP